MGPEMNPKIRKMESFLEYLHPVRQETKQLLYTASYYPGRNEEN
jgi:hypothetical protein